MRPLTFSPGPSKISTETYADITRAIDEGVLEWSHRSGDFYTLSHDTKEALRTYHSIPPSYHILFLDSASSAWHSMIANVVENHSGHIVNGAFSKKAAEASEMLYKETSTAAYPLGSAPEMDRLSLPKDVELITTCFNESSTGVMLEAKDIETLRNTYPDTLLGIDVTSCAGAVALPILEADIWYFSVQKAFGLPAGLGVLIINERAYQQSLRLEEKRKNFAGLWRWRTFIEAEKKIPGQTPQTPNMLGIYLLKQQCERYIKKGGIAEIEKETRAKAARIDTMIEETEELSHFVTDTDHRSPTIVTIKAEHAYIKQLQEAAKKQGIVLGSGYGSLKDETFRIANFPAISIEDIRQFSELLECVRT